MPIHVQKHGREGGVAGCSHTNKWADLSGAWSHLGERRGDWWGSRLSDGMGLKNSNRKWSRILGLASQI
jgi:hypothetical protein